MKIRKPCLIIVLFFICWLNLELLSAKEVPFTLEDRDRLIRVETKIEQIDKRIDQIDKRIDQIDKRIDQMMSFIWILAVIFVGITSTTIGFAIWDRRTMIRPFEARVKEIERFREIDEDKLDRLIQSLRELAKKNIEIADALKKFNLL
ncbi:MAG: hypothetical protein AB1633_02725 [Elusimicrobiota bacterium]